MKAFAGMLVGGTIAVVLFKLLAMLLLPLLGAAVGFFLTVMKWVFLAAVAYLVYSMFFKRKKEREAA